MRNEWTKEEDVRLSEIWEKYGDQGWSKVADEYNRGEGIEKRTQESISGCCRKKRDLKKLLHVWKKEEIDTLTDITSRYSSRLPWDEITKEYNQVIHIKGLFLERSKASLQNYYYHEIKPAAPNSSRSNTHDQNPSTDSTNDDSGDDEQIYFTAPAQTGQPTRLTGKKRGRGESEDDEQPASEVSIETATPPTHDFTGMEMSAPVWTQAENALLKLVWECLKMTFSVRSAQGILELTYNQAAKAQGFFAERKYKDLNRQIQALGSNHPLRQPMPSYQPNSIHSTLQTGTNTFMGSGRF